MPRVSAEMEKYEAATTAYLKNKEATGLSENTIQSYATCLNQFCEHMLNFGFSSEGPCFTAVQSWRNELIGTHKPATVHQLLTELRLFFNWASDPEMGEAQWYDSNPVAKSLFPSQRSRKTRPYDAILSDMQVANLWENKRPSGAKRKFWARNYAIVILILTTALRNSEILDLTVNDLDFENEEITVRHGKGDKFRVVDFPIIAQTAVKIYLKSGTRPDNVQDSDFLFGTLGDPIEGKETHGSGWKRGTRQWLSKIVMNHVESVTGVPLVRSHDLRHISARLYLNNGIPLEELQAMLGHENPRVTQIYSGRLMPQKRRKKAQNVFNLRDICAKENEHILSMLA